MDKNTKIRSDKKNSLKEREGFPEHFCPVPFTTLILNPTGIVGSCREKGCQHEIGNIKTQTIDEIWNGEKIKAWRREFLTGNIKTCKQDMKHKSCHKLQSNNELLKFVEMSEIQKVPIRRLSPDFNSQCNLKCVFCHIWKGPNGLYDEIENFWENAEVNLFPHLTHMDPLAGEPFIQKDLYKTIDIMAVVNPNCEWKFTTNAHWNFTPYIKGKLDKIKISCISVSLDSIRPEGYRKIRNGRLEKVLETINDLIEYSKERQKKGRPIDLILNSTISRDNWEEIPEILEFSISKNIKPFIQYVYEPFEHSLSTLDEKKRRNILKHYLSTFSAQEIMFGHRVIKALIDTFPKMEQEKYIQLCDLIMGKQFTSDGSIMSVVE